MNFLQAKPYRKDIDGLRAIAVFSVILFHFGIFPNGYLGVDIFFVISGYLITGIIYREINKNQFSIINFYLRRTRRIIPLTLFLVFLSLLVGFFVMLPDDLENLGQSAIATNLFANNILQAITTKNYWDVVNEYKPLMHTWSLGIEEQYYIAYPLILILIGKNHKKWLLPLLCLLAIISIALHLLPIEDYKKFYYLPFRFFELAAGGIAAIYLKDNVINHNYSSILILTLILSLLAGPTFLPSQIAPILAVIITLGIIITDNSSKTSLFILQNKISIFFGLISFSLYMWHQIILSYSRYFVFKEIENIHIPILISLIIFLSLLTYYTIEKPFRNKNIIRTKTMLLVLGILFTATTSISFYIYQKGGVVKNIPELGISKSQSARGIHAKYNSRIYDYDKKFSNNSNKIKVLVIGNSFARDWANVLFESKYRKNIELSYIYNPSQHPETQTRANEADIIFISTATRDDVKKLNLENLKTFIVGTKNFGKNSGYFYNYSGDNYFKQRTLMEEGYMEKNENLKKEWGERYIDLIAKIIDKKNTVPVFTPDNMFISQDCRHLTKAGAIYFSQLFEDKLSFLLEYSENRKSNT